MNKDAAHWQAGKYLITLRSTISLSEFGFRIQGLAAHVLLRLGARILEVNSKGHPDIVAEDQRGIMRIEVEADIHGFRARTLEEADFKAIAPRSPTDKGYFALALCGPYPRWLVMDYARLRRRASPASPAIFQALAESEPSARWTSEFIDLVVRHHQHLRIFSFGFLCRLALQGKSL